MEGPSDFCGDYDVSGTVFEARLLDKLDRKRRLDARARDRKKPTISAGLSFSGGPFRFRPISRGTRD
jgi:hypothetical protein